jgi:hypothetical protein
VINDLPSELIKNVRDVIVDAVKLFGMAHELADGD